MVVTSVSVRCTGSVSTYLGYQVLKEEQQMALETEVLKLKTSITKMQFQTVIALYPAIQTDVEVSKEHPF